MGKRDFKQRVFHAGETFVADTEDFGILIIEPGAKLLAPAGKYLTLTVNGVVKPLVPGEYRGDVILSVTEYYVQKMYPSGARYEDTPMEAALVVQEGKVLEAQSASAAIIGGKVTGKVAQGIYVGAEKGVFGGVIVSGDGAYLVRDSHFDLEDPSGEENDDFLGKGAGVCVPDGAKVTVENCDFRLTSIARCAIHAGGTSDVTVNNCRMVNLSPNCEMGDFSWGISATGTNRLNQLCDDATVRYNNCYFASNGWGVLSVDGNNTVYQYVKDCYVELSGPRSYGYGTFCIGDSHFEIDHTKFNVNGFPILTMGMGRKATLKIKNGCEITGRRFGLNMMSDEGLEVDISDSTFRTASSCLVAKSSNSNLRVSNTTFEAGNGVILQMMDGDDPGPAVFVDVSIYDKEDTYIEGRALSVLDPMRDFTIAISDSDLKGNLFNSTTNLRTLATREIPEGLPKHPDLQPPGALSPFYDLEETDGELVPRRPMPEPKEGEAPRMERFSIQGPQNLGVTLLNTRLEGAISSAKQHYAPQFDYIDDTIRSELGHITQEAAPTVNNGVCVRLEGASKWIVTETSYITALSIGADAEVLAPVGKRLLICVDGAEAQLAPGGEYSGRIVLSVD